MRIPVVGVMLFLSLGAGMFCGDCGKHGSRGGGAIVAEAGGAGTVDLDVAGGRHSGSHAVLARIRSGGTGP